LNQDGTILPAIDTEKAAEIIANRFVDVVPPGKRNPSRGYMPSGNKPIGVFISRRLVRESSKTGVKGDVTIEVTFQATSFEMYFFWELSETERHGRAWCIPAAVLNQGSVRLMTRSEVDAISHSQSDEAWNGYPLPDVEPIF